MRREVQPSLARALATLCAASLFWASSWAGQHAPQRAANYAASSQISTGKGAESAQAGTSVALEDGVNSRTSRIVSAISEIQSEALLFSHEDESRTKTAAQALKDLVSSAGFPQCEEVGTLLIKSKEERKLRCIAEGSEKLLFLVRNVTRDVILIGEDPFEEKMEDLEKETIASAKRIQTETRRCVDQEPDFQPNDLDRILDAVHTCVRDAIRDGLLLSLPEHEILEWKEISKLQGQNLHLEPWIQDIGHELDTKKKKKRQSNGKRSKDKRRKKKNSSGTSHDTDDSDNEDYEKNDMDGKDEF